MARIKHVAAPAPREITRGATTMSAGEASLFEETTPAILPPASSIPQKRALEDDHIPAVSSPLNPDFKAKAQDDAPFARDRVARAKKESLKKRESKAGPAALDTNARATPDPKANTKSKKKKDVPAPMRYKLPPPKTTDFEAPRGPTFIPAHKKPHPKGPDIQFHETTDHVYNKKNFHYTHCIADPSFPSSLYYRQSETEPFGPRLNFEDTSTHMFLDESGKHVTTDKGFRMAKGNVVVREGRWYYECRITSGIPKRKSSTQNECANGHVRMGWARREATLDAPVGYDAYSYGLRDVAGQKVFMSRPKDFFPNNEDIREGDIIGLEINLPSESLHRKVVDGHYNPAVDLEDEGNVGIERADIIRDRVPIRFKTHLYFEQIEYHATKELEELMNPSPIIQSSGGIGGSGQEPGPTHPVPSLRTLPHSNIKVYKNGQYVGTPFNNLLTFLPPSSKPLPQVGAREGLDDGMLGYYPAISVFRGGAAEVNFGPDFWYPPGGDGEPDDEVDMIGSDQPTTNKLQKLRAAGERYDEQIVEDIVYDIVDEVDFWMQDGGVSGKAAANDIRSSAGVSLPSAMISGGLGSEIKELVQEDD
ncbi:Ash2-trithorax family protein [Diplocarpon rosae]|nr:Ash2-trithorax family protein [Diplocarpon rosae]